VDRPAEIRPALERAFKSGLPACINVICDPDAEYPRSSVLM
jgi:acetolactate synthase-1/2/3 large subunit